MHGQLNEFLKINRKTHGNDLDIPRYVVMTWV
jgi:hypothetical protein